MCLVFSHSHSAPAMARSARRAARHHADAKLIKKKTTIKNNSRARVRKAKFVCSAPFPAAPPAAPSGAKTWAGGGKNVGNRGAGPWENVTKQGSGRWENVINLGKTHWENVILWWYVTDNHQLDERKDIRIHITDIVSTFAQSSQSYFSIQITTIHPPSSYNPKPMLLPRKPHRFAAQYAAFCSAKPCILRGNAHFGAGRNKP